ncbi:4'-phosphopantetheinyl transferase family protein [Pigmentiphaga aceris]|uniref:4'-phosphopantetheinyl transferase family protein n=1 Tax=Pigmentiphaga aceris TaxID=1940612 RepID=UPI001652285A|nr:4'-phosphopantetheinyl transferase superfamily protein [Pigmentiphaga aceris]
MATAPSGWQLGVDLEQIRPRDVEALSTWMASDVEAAALAQLPPDLALRHFYRLWTFKEAMVKARAQDFPADLKRNTLTMEAGSGRWCIGTAPDMFEGRDWALRMFEAEPGWLLSVVWKAPPGTSADISWHIESDAPATPFALVAACDGSSVR